MSPELAEVRDKVRKKVLERALLNSVEQTLSREEQLELAISDKSYEVGIALKILKNINPKSVPLSSAVWRLERISWDCGR